jgi:hypothetical protein
MIPLMLEHGYSPGKRKRRLFFCNTILSILNVITLPRQARDKRRESSKQEWRFCADGWLGILLGAETQVACLQPSFSS